MKRSYLSKGGGNPLLMSTFLSLGNLFSVYLRFVLTLDLDNFSVHFLCSGPSEVIKWHFTQLRDCNFRFFVI